MHLLILMIDAGILSCWPQLGSRWLTLIRHVRATCLIYNLCRKARTKDASISQDMERLKKAQSILAMSEEERASRDRATWTAWLNSYRSRQAASLILRW